MRDDDAVAAKVTQLLDVLADLTSGLVGNKGFVAL
jgi:hypothetical protein